MRPKELFVEIAALLREIPKDAGPRIVDLLGQHLVAAVGQVSCEVQQVVLRLFKVAEWAPSFVERLENDADFSDGADFVDKEAQAVRNPPLKFAQPRELLNWSD